MTVSAEAVASEQARATAATRTRRAGQNERSPPQSSAEQSTEANAIGHLIAVEVRTADRILGARSGVTVTRPGDGAPEANRSTNSVAESGMHETSVSGPS